MFHFADTILIEEERTKLLQAVTGIQPFQEFSHLLKTYNSEKKWQLFVRSEIEKRLRIWCQAQGFVLR